jgi:DNA polymerase III subunit beta
MKFTLPISTLLRAISSVAWARPERSTKTELSTVKIQAVDGSLFLSATDLESGVSLQVAGVTIDKEGECLIDPDRTIQLLSPEGGRENVTCTLSSSHLNLDVGGGGKLKVKAMEATGFPSVDRVPISDNAPKMQAGRLKSRLASVLFAAEQADTSARFVTNSCCLELFDDGEVALISTDTRSLAFSGDKSQLANKPVSELLLPLPVCSGLKKFFNDDAESVAIEVVNDESGKPREVLFMGERGVIRSRLLEGRAVPYRDVFKKVKGTSARVVSLPNSELSRLSRQAIAVTTQELQRASLTISSEEGITFECTGEGEVFGQVLPNSDGGEDVKIFLNPKYLYSIVSHVSGESVEFRFIDATSPVVFETMDNSYLLMPLVE